MQIRVKVTPNAKGNEVIGWEEDPRAGRVLRVRLQAPPVDGKANKALGAFLARELGLSKSRVVLVKGTTSRSKLLELPDGTRLPV
jgi:uncharacterized protein (TIGR00251 family)